MKKLLMAGILALAIIPVAVVLTACGGLGSVKTELVGEWEGRSANIFMNSMTLSANGNVSINTGVGTETGTWGVSGSRLNMRIDGETDGFNFTLTEEGSVLTLTLTEAGVTLTWIFDRVVDDSGDDDGDDTRPGDDD